MILIWKTNVHIFLSFMSSAELNHDNTIKIITQSMGYVELNRAPIPHPVIRLIRQISKLHFPENSNVRLALYMKRTGAFSK